MRQTLIKYFNKKMLGLLLLGFASGLPMSLIGVALQARFHQEYSKNLILIGSMTALFLPYSFKYLWAALFDKYQLPFKGLDNRKSWILLFQVLIITLLLLMGLIDTTTELFHFPVLLIIAFLLAFCGASQDIVIDAYRVESLNEQEVGLGSSLTVEGYRIAMLVSSVVAFFVSQTYGWKMAYLAMPWFMAFGILGLYLVPNTSKSQTGTNNTDNPDNADNVDNVDNLSIVQQIIVTFKEFFQRDQAIYILLFIALYKLPDVFAHALVTPFLIELDFSNKEIGLLIKSIGMAATLIGVFFGGLLMTRIKIWNALLLFGILAAITNLVYYFLAVTGKNVPLASLGIMLENLCSGMGTAAFVGFITSITNKKYAALQYALFTSFTALSRAYAGVLAGFIANGLGWKMYFIISVFTAIPSLLLLIKFSGMNADKLLPYQTPSKPALQI